MKQKIFVVSQIYDHWDHIKHEFEIIEPFIINKSHIMNIYDGTDLKLIYIVVVNEIDYQYCINALQLEGLVVVNPRIEKHAQEQFIRTVIQTCGRELLQELVSTNNTYSELYGRIL